MKPGGLANNIGGNQTPDKKSDKKPTQTEDHSHIPNGHANSARTIRKFVKKPNGTPKTSPKFQKQFSLNRVTPLPLPDMKDTDDLGLDMQDEGDNVSRTECKSQQSKGTVSLDTRRTTSSIQFELDHFVVKADDKFVSNISKGTLANAVTKTSTTEGQTERAGSADSKEMYDQWVDEIIEGSRESSPSKSDTAGSPSHKHHKSKKHKKEKKERKNRDRSSEKEERQSRNSERKEKKTPRNKTPTSDELLLVDSDAPPDESAL